MHGNYNGNYTVIPDTVKILSTTVEMVEILKVVITDMVKILSTMVDILKCPIEKNLSTNFYQLTALAKSTMVH